MTNMVQLARGLMVSPSELSGIEATTTSTVQNSRGHNAMILACNFTAGAGTFTVKIQARTADNAYVDMYDSAGNLMQLNAITADRAMLFVGIPADFKIVATEDADGATVTVSYELLTV